MDVLERAGSTSLHSNWSVRLTQWAKIQPLPASTLALYSCLVLYLAVVEAGLYAIEYCLQRRRSKPMASRTGHHSGCNTKKSIAIAKQRLQLLLSNYNCLLF